MNSITSWHNNNLFKKSIKLNNEKMVQLEIINGSKASEAATSSSRLTSTNISDAIPSTSNLNVKSITAPITIRKSVPNAEKGFQSVSPQMIIANKPLLIVYMPNQQRTIISVNCGQTLRVALARAMKKRLLTVDMCCVFFHSNE